MTISLEEYASFDAIGLASLVRNKQVSAGELATVALEAAQIVNASINCIAHFTPRTASECLDNTNRDAPFAGVPFLIKDAAVAGEVFDQASRLGLGRVAPSDSEITTRFKKCGVTILGLSTWPEAGNATTTEAVVYGATRNPWNLGLSPGGSSGGAAAAVISGVVPIAHASDGAGSIRIPAACCGTVGLKPSRARTAGVHSGSYALGASHIVSRTVRDTAAMLDCTHGHELGSPYFIPKQEERFLESLESSMRPLSIGFSNKSPAGTRVDIECAEAVDKAASLCEAFGHKVQEVTLPYEWPAFFQAFVDLWSYRHVRSVRILESETGRKLSSENREGCNLAMFRHAKELTSEALLDSISIMDDVCRRVAYFFEEYDAFISPVVTRHSLRLSELNANASDLTAYSWLDSMLSEHAAFTPVFNVTGQPAISLPLYQSGKGLPVGVQVAARVGDECTLLQLASSFEETLPWVKRVPPHSVAHIRNQNSQGC